MQVKGIIWVGTATPERSALVSFFADRLGMEVHTDVAGYTRLTIQNGDRVEIFGPEANEYEHLDTGPVAGFWVEDAAAAREELVEAGIEASDLETGRDGHRWFYFKAPDGNFYELCEHDRDA